MLKNSSNNHIHWNLSFIGAVQDWELESLDLFLDLSYSSKIHLKDPNIMLWTQACNRDFEAKSYYNSLVPGEPCMFHALAFILIFTFL